MRRKISKPVFLENILIEDVAAEGCSIAKIDQKVVFINYGVPGDLVDIKITQSKKNFAQADITNIHQKSDKRITPFCSHFGYCGGCQWQMMDYKFQVEAKQQIINQQFFHLGGFSNLPQKPIIAAEKNRYYRNKIEYSFSTYEFLTPEKFNPDLKNNLSNAAGYHVKNNFKKVIHIDTCYLQDELTNEIRKIVVQYLINHNLSYYNPVLHQGWFRNLILRNNTQNEWMVILVVSYEDNVALSEIKDILVKECNRIISIFVIFNNKQNDSIFDLQPNLLYFQKDLCQELGELKFKISPKSFFQTNPYQAFHLYEAIKAMVQNLGLKILYDLYCGTGSIGIYLHKLFDKIFGIDIISEAIQDAQENAHINQISNVHFFCGDVLKICTADFIQQHQPPDCIIIDPPRNGVHPKFVEFLITIKATYLVYVSCNPATQVRDLKLLTTHYTIENMQAIDMFPHTQHIENICLLKLKNLS
ncbi:MAG: 23S rRNA (uracil(1939)-C(5))-methyltransferase RlmD [Sediminibacterium sp.]|nr:23S rRNA (uracil(1939)-C(5))-methyltransferase RlmD [Sediminibacterium sp.]